MISHLAIFVVVFSLMMTLATYFPEFLSFARRRYQSSIFLTSRELNRFFLHIKPSQIIALFGAFAIAVFIFTGSWVFAFALVALGFGAPKLALIVYKDLRSSKFEAQLLDALILLGNTLKSGQDITAGFEKIAHSMKPPVSEEFGLAVNAIRLGASLEGALLDLTNRISSRHLDTVVYALIIQRETGGNVLKILDQMTLSLREENKLHKKVMALTSQGRTQIVVMAVIPWILGGFLIWASPDMMTPVLQTNTGQMVVVALLIWEAIGIMVTRRITMVQV